MAERCEEIIDRDEKSVGSTMKIRLYPLVAESAKGSIIKDVDGKEYIDFTANWGVASTGYCHPKVVKSIQNQAAKNTFASYTTVLTESGVELAEKLLKLVPGDFEKKVWFGLSGSDANDCISKMIPMSTGRSRIISYLGAYHGQTMGSLSMSGHTAQAKFIGSGNVVKIPYPYCYRCAFDKKRENCNLDCLKFLENNVFKTVSPPEDTGAIVVEAIQCDGGDVVPPVEYMKELEGICRRHGILLAFDEVKIGIGRTGKMFGFEHFGVTPDVVIIGKPIASGMPLSGVIARKEVLDAGVATHLFTTGGCPVSTEAANATLDVILNEGLMENATKMGDYLKSGLKEMMKKYELIGDIRGKGLIIGAELVRDRNTKEPADTETAKIAFRAFQKGLVLFYVGIDSNVLEFTPPLTITKEEIDKGLQILDESISDVLNGKVSEEEMARYAGW